MNATTAKKIIKNDPDNTRRVDLRPGEKLYAVRAGKRWWLYQPGFKPVRISREGDPDFAWLWRIPQPTASTRIVRHILDNSFAAPDLSPGVIAEFARLIDKAIRRAVLADRKKR